VHSSHRSPLPFAALAPVAAAAVAALLAALTPATAAAHANVRAATGAATAVTATSATLNGDVDSGHAAEYWFEYGVNANYDAATTPQPVAPGEDVPVSAAVSGLAPATVYHYRLVARIPGRLFDVDKGADRTFTTAAAAAPPASAAPAPVAVPAAPLPAAAPITLGASVGVAPLKGTVTVKVPGAAGFTALGAGATVPVGAVLDTRKGTVQLTTAVDGGQTQTATFHSGVFEVRQSPTGHGLTDIVLRGPALGCPRVRRSGSATARAAAAQARRRPPKRQLWARDRGGRFRTHGKNSVATVRGTSWVTTDTCAGTRTTVREGSVSVRDTRRHRTIVVRAGKSYLARRR
jgi:hypothetical protein